LTVLQPNKAKPPAVAPINKKPRASNKPKPPPPIKNQPNIDVCINTINETVPLDIIPDVPPVVVDLNLEREDKAALTNEEAQVAQELSKPLSQPKFSSWELNSGDFSPTASPVHAPIVDISPHKLTLA
jgi:hypothetical protein